MQSHDEQVGTPRDFEFHGKVYPVSGLTPYQLGEIEAHLKDAFPSPLKEYSALMKECGDGFTPEERKELFEAARAAAVQRFDDKGRQLAGHPVTFHSDQAEEYLFKGKGIGTFVRVVLSKHTPGLSRADDARLGSLCSPEDLFRLCELIQTRGPEEEGGGGENAAADDPDCELPPGVYDPK